jgi:hypothetical protein
MRLNIDQDPSNILACALIPSENRFSESSARASLAAMRELSIILRDAEAKRYAACVTCS